MNQISLKRRAYRNNIRQQQIQASFAEVRARMAAPPPLQARNLLREALLGIKSYIDGDAQSNMYHFLQQYRQIAQKYFIYEVLLHDVLFSCELPQVRKGLLPVECSWAQVFLYLNELEENPDIQQQLLKILQINFYQLRNCDQNHLQKSIFVLREMISRMSFDWAENKNYWDVFCELFGEVLICSQLLGLEQQCLSEQFGGIYWLDVIISKGFSCLKQQSHHMVIEVCLLALTLLYNCKMNSANSASIKLKLAPLIVKHFQDSRTPFDKNCQYIRRFALAGGCLLQEQTKVLKSFLPSALECQEPKYFEMINALICLQQIQLEMQFCSNLLLFGMINSANCPNEYQVWQVKKWIILILKESITNKTHQNRMQKATLIYELWIYNNDVLPMLLKQMNSFEEYMTGILIELVEEVLTICDKRDEMAPKVIGILDDFPQFSSEMKALWPVGGRGERG